MALSQPDQDDSLQPLPAYRSILLAADSSDHANRALTEAVALAGLWDAEVTGIHVYAAKMHDVRFRQMEGGLPEQFRAEQELERQRDVHDDLITRGLSIITDSYLDQAQRACSAAAVRFARRSPEGKNYRRLTEEANSGDYDLLVLGALGLGAIEGSRLGSVCQRVTRRAGIDTLVIKNPRRALAGGPIVVAVDGSRRAYGGLLTAFALSARWGAALHVVAAFDPYYHYVAFNRIAGVLSEEAGKVFRFKEQEQLHEEIIDSGLAKIYDGHLSVARSLAEEYGVEIETTLLDGKPHDAIEKFLKKREPSLLVIGKLGIHADSQLDIGGNAERLLQNVDCSVLLSQREHQPRVEQVAAVTTSWTTEAEQRMQRVPSFVRGMAGMAILRYAQERGHTVITARIVEEATANLMPGHAEQAMAEIVAADAAGELGRERRAGDLQWSRAARALLQSVEDVSLRANLAMRAEKKARALAAPKVEADHVKAFVTSAETDSGAQQATGSDPAGPGAGAALDWSAEAEALLDRVPQGFCRDMTRRAAEAIAARAGSTRIDAEFVEQVQGVFAAGAATASESLAWSEEARARIARAPEMVRGMLVREIEAWAGRNGLQRVDHGAVDAVKREWQQGGVFHLDPFDERKRR